MSLQGIFQIGYVTHDLERAIDRVGSGFKLSEFNLLDLELPLRTPEGAKTANLRVATVWAGQMQIELIQPLSGHVDTYIAGLPADKNDPTPRFHHVAVRRESLEDMRSEVASLNLPLVFETEGAGIHSIFIDARSRIGHPLELVCSSPEGWAMMGWPG